MESSRHSLISTRVAMNSSVLILHGGALGDLALTLQLALRLVTPHTRGGVELVSRTNPGDMSNCRPRVVRRSPEGLGLHWLHGESDDPPPERLCGLIAGRCVLSALNGEDSLVHRRLLELGPRAVYSFDPRPEPGLDAHITTQWQRQLEGQGLLFPKCIHQGRGPRTLHVPAELCDRGHSLLKKAGVESRPILIHPGSGGRAKCWPLRCFAAVARELLAAGRAVCFVLGPVETERWPADDFQATRVEFPLLESPAPDDLLAILAACRVLLSNDAGPAHLAALIGTPTVTVFGPTSPTTWQPLSSGARVIAGDPNAHPDDWGIDAQKVLALFGSPPQR